MHISRTPLSRRHVLRTSGAALALPLFDAMIPVFGSRAHAAEKSPHRFVAMCAGLGFHAPHFFPDSPGPDPTRSLYLSPLKDLKNDFSLLSGLCHPNQQGNNGHASSLTWLTSAERPGLAGFKQTISLDQRIAQAIGIETRYPYLALTTTGGGLSWTASGVEIPAESSPSKLFKALFIEGTVNEVAQEMQNLKVGRSILDTVLGEATKLHRELGHRDQEKLDEYLTSVRELEERLQQSEGWIQRPKP
ncbi:MAG: DUF1552 domain-containing protein, partial [Verrucomicrobiota bacterium]